MLYIIIKTQREDCVPLLISYPLKNLMLGVVVAEHNVPDKKSEKGGFQVWSERIETKFL